MSQYNDLNTRYSSTDGEHNPTTTDLTTVRKGLERLLRTPKGHDPFNRNYGCRLYDLLFENKVSPTDVQVFLYMDITDWEPRLNITVSDISIERVDNNSFRVTCYFRLNNVSSGVSTLITRE